ncbi:hypothetical protein EV200_103386 [Pedobacter psychrotolerans]|uniref:Uncharacterized protein n=1 Tax=Pedobacter psychrotolerans TaxID=1843235 RepID=A0A4R2HJ76_9SPHI|nr:hypothetical protein [Pedobacter psychrotolerans]TCO27053.1 hypothetical protein EV200_103386 [Pedobacter psychrotolerans]GGE58572.1 hypothetical protein GCM10011413_26270 [Pedobacter psychrotolerans]
MKNILSLIITLLSLQHSFAQQDILRLKNVVGKTPLRTQQYSEYVGSAFFSDVWSKGIVKDVNGTSIKDIELKYDELTDELLFRSNDGQELGFAVQVSQFEININTSGNLKKHFFKNGFPAIAKSSERSFFEILHNGKINLLKKNYKRVEESRAFNTATVTKTIINRLKYFTYDGFRITEFKRDIKSLQKVFGETSLVVIEYIKNQKLDIKNDDDLIKVLEFYSGL